ncbi:MAG: hypothetical protein KME32_22490 [Mojavia pulchra JT2-VF2]|jgi:hypothetical protein|uniref:Uncharacterized protein n=1 Tax=Mojavia pulchra JT2-VF2 TaxID=287848 RepID=A0A951Q226_9NOST|nr:hypothetical protein [Mojavia pulchra JT2-VF2]
MKLNNIKHNFFPIIKIISSVLIASAIGLELWNIYAAINNIKVPNSLNPVFWIERIAVVSHLVEAVIAAFYAPSKQKMPLQYGTYTFFVGTVALLELFGKEDKL